MADDDEGLGEFWDVLALELGIAVMAEREVVDRINSFEERTLRVLESRFESSECSAAWSVFSFVIPPLRRSRSDEDSASVIGITILIRPDCLWPVACRA
jgi:hypothetical protein